MFKTPSGSPARTHNSPNASAESGVCSAGLTITVHLTASAGAIFRVIIALGKLLGVIAATTPTACRSTMMRLFAAVAGIVAP